MILKIYFWSSELVFQHIFSCIIFLGLHINQSSTHFGCKHCKKSSAFPEFYRHASPSDYRWLTCSYTGPEADATSWKQSFGLSATGLWIEFVTILILGPPAVSSLYPFDYGLFLFLLFILFTMLVLSRPLCSFRLCPFANASQYMVNSCLYSPKAQERSSDGRKK